MRGRRERGEGELGEERGRGEVGWEGSWSEERGSGRGVRGGRGNDENEKQKV